MFNDGHDKISYGYQKLKFKREMVKCYGPY